ncbi:unnamed protein product [Rhodiola kirilowii]
MAISSHYELVISYPFKFSLLDTSIYVSSINSFSLTLDRIRGPSCPACPKVSESRHNLRRSSRPILEIFGNDFHGWQQLPSLMGSMRMTLFAAFLLVIGVATHGAQAQTTVTGTVFCDRCKDGKLSALDYPLAGSNITVTCVGADGQPSLIRQGTTNLLGNYMMRFDGTPDLSNCSAQLSGNNSQQGARACGLAAGPAQKVKLAFKLFNVGMYTVDSLLAQPTQPASACSNSSSPTAGVKASTPAIRLPPLPRLPSAPPLPFIEATACPDQYWTNAQYKCYWRAINPDTKVAVAFGPTAAKKYGTNISLWQSLHGRGDTYKTLLREATTAYLNAFNSLQFPYNAVSVVQRTNDALSGSPRLALLTALKFKRANSGYGKIPCKLTPCK